MAAAVRDDPDRRGAAGGSVLQRRRRADAIARGDRRGHRVSRDQLAAGAGPARPAFGKRRAGAAGRSLAGPGARLCPATVVRRADPGRRTNRRSHGDEHRHRCRSGQRRAFARAGAIFYRAADGRVSGPGRASDLAAAGGRKLQCLSPRCGVAFAPAPADHRRLWQRDVRGGGGNRAAGYAGAAAGAAGGRGAEPLGPVAQPVCAGLARRRAGRDRRADHGCPADGRSICRPVAAGA